MTAQEQWREPEDVEAWAGLDDPDAYQVLAFDPGGTTGWAVFQVHPDAFSGDPDILMFENIEWWTAGQFTGPLMEQVDSAVELAESWPGARLVMEGFKLRQMAVDLAPVEVSFAIRRDLRPRYFVTQTSSMAMNTVTDERQKEWGLWIPGKEHARDAVKHAVTFLKAKREQAIKVWRASTGRV